MNRPIVSVLMLIVLTTLVLNSCRSYIGRRCFERAEYYTFCRSADISPSSGRQVLSNGCQYYIQLPSYRYKSRPFNWADMMGGKFQKSCEIVRVSGEEALYRLHPELARYVTGQSSHKPADIESKCTLVNNPKAVLALCTRRFPIKNAPEKDFGSQHLGHRHVISPYAGIHRALGYTSGVLLDVPITIAQNTTLAAVGVVGFAGSAVIAPVFLPLRQQQIQHAPAETPPATKNSPLRTD